MIFQNLRAFRQELYGKLGRSKEGMLVLALAHTSWSRLYAQTLKERTFEHKPTVMQGNKLITVGQGYSTLAVIPEMQGSWGLPLRHERITRFETPITKGIFQLK